MCIVVVFMQPDTKLKVATLTLFVSSKLLIKSKKPFEGREENDQRNYIQRETLIN